MMSPGVLLALGLSCPALVLSLLAWRHLFWQRAVLPTCEYLEADWRYWRDEIAAVINAELSLHYDEPIMGAYLRQCIDEYRAARRRAS